MLQLFNTSHINVNNLIMWRDWFVLYYRIVPLDILRTSEIGLQIMIKYNKIYLWWMATGNMLHALRLI